MLVPLTVAGPWSWKLSAATAVARSVELMPALEGSAPESSAYAPPSWLT